LGEGLGVALGARLGRLGIIVGAVVMDILVGDDPADRG
jgi:hypothetical protein